MAADRGRKKNRPLTTKLELGKDVTVVNTVTRLAAHPKDAQLTEPEAKRKRRFWNVSRLGMAARHFAKALPLVFRDISLPGRKLNHRQPIALKMLGTPGECW